MQGGAFPVGAPGHPDAGWRALAAAIADCVAQRLGGAFPTPALARAGAGPRPGDLNRHSIEVSTPFPAGSGARRGTDESDDDAHHDGSDDGSDDGGSELPIDREHAATWELVRRAQEGDGEAFGQIYDRYVDTVYRFVFFRVHDRALAEDFTSETFLRALRRIGSITYQGRDIGAWLVTIARNIIFDHMKSARHRMEIVTGETVERDEHAPSPEAAVIEALTSERLMAAVDQLGEEQRECVLLRFIQGFSVAETAEVMGKNEGAIKALQHRAVRKLADLIGGDLR